MERQGEETERVSSFLFSLSHCVFLLSLVRGGVIVMLSQRLFHPNSIHSILLSPFPLSFSLSSSSLTFIVSAVRVSVISLLSNQDFDPLSSHGVR